MPHRAALIGLGLIAGVTVAALMAPGSSSARPRSSREQAVTTAPRASVNTDAKKKSPLRGISLDHLEREDDRYRAKLDDGREVVFTLDPELQEHALGIFAANDVPLGAAVLSDIDTGKLLVLAQHRRAADAKAPGAAFDSSPPAASLFKIITAAALIEKGGVELESSACYHGGSQRLTLQNIIDDPRSDTACASLSSAIGHSLNAVIAKLADKHLARKELAAYANAFGFNGALPFDLPVPRSPAEIPDDRLERARTAAGFWHTHVSPLHAATIAQAVGNAGTMLRPYVVEEVRDARGNLLHQGAPQLLGRPIRKATARILTQAMVGTVENGTARKAFHDRRGRPVLPAISVAGKTGTLTGNNPYRAYSWFMAFAPADKPEVAAAVLVVNEPKWRIKAAETTAGILKKYFDRKNAEKRAAATKAKTKTN